MLVHYIFKCLSAFDDKNLNVKKYFIHFAVREKVGLIRSLKELMNISEIL